VEKKISKFLERLSSRLEDTSGTIELIRTQGVSVLKTERDHWIQFGSFHLSEIYANSLEIKKMIRHHGEYNDDPSQFMYDILGLMSDLFSHSAIFYIYFGAIETTLDESSEYKERKVRRSYRRKLGVSETNTIKKIALEWAWERHIDDKSGIIASIYLDASNIVDQLTTITRANQKAETQYVFMYDVCLRLLSLNTSYLTLKRNWLWP